MRVYGPLIQQPAVLRLHQQPQVCSLCHDPYLHGYQCKMAPGRRLHVEHFSDHDSFLWRTGWEWVQKLSGADNSLRIRVTAFTHPPVIRLTRPCALSWFSDYMQSCNYYGERPWICKLGDKDSGAWRVFISTIGARRANGKTWPFRKTQAECASRKSTHSIKHAPPHLKSHLALWETVTCWHFPTVYRQNCLLTHVYSIIKITVSCSPVLICF